MDHARVANLLLKIAMRMPVLLGPMKFVIKIYVEKALNSAGISTEDLQWINTSEYQMLKDFESLICKHPTKLDVFEKIFTVL